jgi:hypothetical protein
MSTRKTRRTGGKAARERERPNQDEPRDRRFTISLSRSEYQALDEAAAADDRTVAAFARRLLLWALDERR